MKTEHLKNFITVVDLGTVSEAARTLHIAQPALSTQIKALENNIGTPLLKRNAKKIELTAAGKILYDKAKTINHLENSIYSEIKDCINGSRGTLRIGLTHSYPDELITKLFSSFHRVFPDVSFDLFEVHTEEMLRLLRDGIIEIGIMRIPGNVPPSLDTWYIIQEQLTALYSPNTNWFPFDIDAIPIRMLKDIPLSVTKGFSDRVINLCEENGFAPHFLSICSSRLLARMWAENGSAVTILTDTPGIRYPDLCTCPLLGTGALVSRAVVTKKDARISTIAKSFLDYCQNWLPPVTNS